MKLPNKQLWVAERQDRTPRKKVYVFSDRWFDVREAAGMKLNTLGDYSCLFISAVMAPEAVNVFEEDENLVGVFEVLYTGNGASGTLQKNIVEIKPTQKGSEHGRDKKKSKEGR
jgi:hypothetical protein